MLKAFAAAGVAVDLFTGEIFEEIGHGVQVRLRTKYARKTFLHRIATWSLFALATATQLLFRRKPYELFVVTNPPFNLLTALLLNRLRGIDYHVLVFDVYPDALVQYGYLGERSWIVKVWSALMRQVVARAASVVTISESLKEALQKYNATGRTIWVVPTWADNLEVQPIEKTENPFLQRLGLADRKIVLYSG